MSVPKLLAEGPFVTDGGLETDLLFHQGFDLPEFAAFPAPLCCQPVVCGVLGPVVFRERWSGCSVGIAGPGSG